MSQILRQKVINSIQYIGKSFYVNHDTVKLEYLIGNEKTSIKTSYVSLLSVLTYLSKGKQLITGTYGAGKTTTAEAIASIYESMPIEMISQGLLRCNPQLTEEKMIGRPDLGELQKGVEKVIWSYFALSPTNIIDEFNRLPADKQILLLDAIDRGNFTYLNESIKKSGPTYATKNELDGGNADLLAAILDRFSIEVEVNPPAGFLSKINGEKIILSDKEIALEMEQKIKETNSLDELLGLRNKFQAKNKDLIFNGQEKEQIFKEIDNIKIDENAKFLLEYTFAEANFNPSSGYKGQLKIKDAENHWDKYLMNSFDAKMGLSVRWKNSIIDYAKSLAWLKGEEIVSPQIIKSMLPHSLVHKLKSEINQEREPLELSKTSNAIKVSNELYDRFQDDIKLRGSFKEKMIQAMNEKNYSIIKDWNESSHPYYEFLKESLKKEMDDSYDKL